MTVRTVADSSACDVLVVGAGPAGALASAELASRGRSVLCIDHGYFPRFVIGESLLPRCNDILEQAGLLSAVRGRGYLPKHGAVFFSAAGSERFDFAEGLPGDTPVAYQVPRADFDQTLATAARARGANVRFGCSLEALTRLTDQGGRARILDRADETVTEVTFRHVLDCSGPGRAVPKALGLDLLDSLDSPAGDERVSAYCHVENDVRPPGAEEGDIWITVLEGGGWGWIIPFANGRTSMGVVCSGSHWDSLEGCSRQRLEVLVRRHPAARKRLADAAIVTPVGVVRGFSHSVTQLHGAGWTLAGNATGFVDPVFSSGVLLALESGQLAATLIDRQLAGTTVDWDTDYVAPVLRRAGVFWEFARSWYAGDLERIFFSPKKMLSTKRKVTSLLAGNLHRTDNSFVSDPKDSIAQLLSVISRA